MSFVEIIAGELQSRGDYRPEMAADIRRWSLLWRTVWQLGRQLQYADKEGEWEERWRLQPLLTEAIADFHQFGATRLLVEVVPPALQHECNEADAIRGLLSTTPSYSVQG